MADLPRRFGHYLLLKTLGAGSMGEVYLARPIRRREGVPNAVVIKCLRADTGVASVNWIRRFTHEAQLAVRVASPHVAKLYDAGCVDDRLYLAMEYIAGWPLSRVLADHVTSRHELSLDSIGDIMEGALLGANALHTAADEVGRPLGIVHRDIAPKNIMVGEDGRAVLIDLGVGKSNLKDWQTRTGAIVGTVLYMPPEQLQGAKVDHRADLYALGAVLYELITLRPFIEPGPLQEVFARVLHPARRPPSTFRRVSSDLDAIVMKALAFEPEERFSSALDFLQALRRVIPKAPRPPIETLIGDMLVQELSVVKTEVKGLAGVEVHTMADPGTTVVLARAPNVALDPGSALDEKHMPTAVVRTRTRSGAHLKRPNSIRIAWIAVIAASVLALITLGMSLERARREKEKDGEVIRVQTSSAGARR